MKSGLKNGCCLVISLAVIGSAGAGCSRSDHVQNSSDDTAPAATSQETKISRIKVMPIGDSITEGNGKYHTYRYYLAQAYPLLDMVGSKNGVYHGNALDEDFDQDHQSYWGKRADEVGRWVAKPARQYRPDVALIHLGTNDLMLGQSTESTIRDLEKLIGELRKASPGVNVFLATVILCNWSRCTGQQDLNAAIATLAASIDTPESPVHLVRMDTLGPDDLYDGLHPNNSGSQKLMQQWEAAMRHAGVL